MTSAAENARSLRARLMAPPNAVADPGIDLHPYRKPQLLQALEPPPRSVVVRLNPKQVYAQRVANIRKREAEGEAEIERLAAIVADFYGLELDDIKGDSKITPLALARQVICHLARWTLRRAYPEISRVLKYRDHTCAMYSARRITLRVATDDDVAADVMALKVLVRRQMEVP